MPVKLTKDEFIAEAQKRYGEGTGWKDWWFQCPVCKVKTKGSEWLEIQPDNLPAFSCIGRLKGSDQGLHTSRKDRTATGCNYTNGGLFQFHQIEATDPEDGHVYRLFNFADDPLESNESSKVEA